MPLNIISNFAAQVAHRNLTMSDKGASSSVAKISAGTRVLGARDDAAALAIGSRLRAEVAAMTQASVNAGQAVSMLQIADGAMSQINDTLVRMKSLAVQAGSDQLGSVERGLINTEFQQLLTEIERIAEDTEFNGQALINGGVLSTLVNASDPGTNGIASISFDSSVQNESVFQYSYNATGEILTVTKQAVDGETTNTATDIQTGQLASNNLSFTLAESANADDVFIYSYAEATEQLTVTNERTGESATIDITSAFNATFGSSVDVIGSGETLDVEFASLGVTVTLDDNFDRTAALGDTLATSVAAGDANLTLANATYAHGTGTITSSALTNVLTALGGNYDAATGVATIAVTASLANNNTVITGIAGIDFGSGVGANHTVADGAAAEVDIADANGVIIGTITADFTGAANAASSIVLNLGGLVQNVQTNTSGSDESVQVDLTNSLDAVAGAGNNLSFDQTVDVDIAQFGVSLTLDKSFDRTTSITTTTGTVTDGSTPLATASFATNSGFLNADVYQALLDLGYDSVNGLGYNANDGLLTLQIEDVGAVVQLNGLAGISFDNGVAGENSADLAGTTATTDIAITLADGSKVSLGGLTGTYTAGADETGTVSIQLGAGVFFNSVNEDALTNDFTFKIGTGNETFDRITLSLNSVNQQALGINGLDVTTAATADAASTAISTAINTLNTARANVGAFQNRLDIAASNLATARENTEAARSALLDLDVAQEMTTFTSQQILVQAGVSMLAQANQLPQNLLRLLQ
jgi:flagellin